MCEIVQNKIFFLFDGECNLCNNFVKLILLNDNQKKIVLISLQSPLGKSILSKYDIKLMDFSSSILIEKDKIFTKSSAVLKVFRNLQGWRKLIYCLIVVPTPIRNVIYDWIARNRLLWFGQSKFCLIMTPEVKSRFLD